MADEEIARSRIVAAMDHAVQMAHPDAETLPSSAYYELRLDEWVATLSAAGFVIVPVEPTETMIDAGDDILPFARGTETYRMAGGITPEKMWAAMIAQAPFLAKGQSET